MSSWARLPTYLVNFPLKLLPLSKHQQALYDRTGYATEIAFRTIPKAGKNEIRQYLRKLYRLDVAKVRTLNYEGKKKRNKYGYYRRADFKKAYVTLRPPKDGKQKVETSPSNNVGSVSKSETSTSKPEERGSKFSQWFRGTGKET